MKDEKGLTLVEVLAALTILTIIGGIIWGVFIQGSKYSADEMTKNQIQQEANIISEHLKKIHQAGEPYQISAEDNKITITVNGKEEVFQSNLFNFSLNSTTLPASGEVNPKIENEQNITLIIENKQNPTNYFELDIILYRLKERVDNDE